MNYSTHAKSKETATKRAKELCNYLNKKLCKGWKYRVYHNTGWHFRVTLGSISVHEHIPTKNYFAMVNNKKNMPYAALAMWSDDFESKDPIKCVKHAVKLSEQAVSGLVAVIEDNRKHLSKKG
jgi:hypothetical protein